MRHKFDAYFTPPWQTRALLAHQPIRGVILEPCVGDGSIARELPGVVLTNDIDSARRANYHFDASDAGLYAAIQDAHGGVDWVVTNPPYQMPLCTNIVRQAVKHARKGVAMLLRISFREPTAKVNPRGPFLAQYPPSRLLTLPRHSYTGDGKSDSATTEWVVWLRDGSAVLGPPILSLHNADVKYSGESASLFAADPA